MLVASLYANKTYRDVERGGRMPRVLFVQSLGYGGSLPKAWAYGMNGLWFRALDQVRVLKGNVKE